MSFFYNVKISQEVLRRRTQEVMAFQTLDMIFFVPPKSYCYAYFNLIYIIETNCVESFYVLYRNTLGMYILHQFVAFIILYNIYIYILLESVGWFIEILI